VITASFGITDESIVNASKIIIWRYYVKTVKDKDVCRFIQSRLGELKVSETRYGDLLEEADQEYPKLVDMLNLLIEK